MDLFYILNLNFFMVVAHNNFQNVENSFWISYNVLWYFFPQEYFNISSKIILH